MGEHFDSIKRDLAIGYNSLCDALEQFLEDENISIVEDRMNNIRVIILSLLYTDDFHDFPNVPNTITNIELKVFHDHDEG